MIKFCGCSFGGEGGGWICKTTQNYSNVTALQGYIVSAGSAFCRIKPQHGWLSVSRRAILRVLFLPLYHHWCVKIDTNRPFFIRHIC